MMADTSKLPISRVDELIDKLNEINNNFNIINNKLDSMKYVIESGSNENNTQWYRKWNDGWIEQGGYMPAGISDTITFIKPFTNTEYFSVFTPYKNMESHIVYIKSKYNDRISIYNGDSKENPISWYACGY